MIEILEDVFAIIGFAAVTVLWICSEPTNRLRDYLFKEKDNWFNRLINCAMCSGFHIYLWPMLLMNGSVNILYAAIVSVLAEFTVRKLNEGSI